MNIQQEIEQCVSSCMHEDVRLEYTSRLKKGNLVRDDNEESHFCVYFVPFNREKREVLIGDHKKSGLWLMPGGHVDAGESLLETVNREIEEELGVSDFFHTLPEPFLLSVTNIVNDVRPCKKHFDIWFAMDTDGTDFKIDYAEYNEVRWVTMEEAKKIIIDPANIDAINRLECL